MQAKCGTSFVARTREVLVWSPQKLTFDGSNFEIWERKNRTGYRAEKERQKDDS